MTFASIVSLINFPRNPLNPSCVSCVPHFGVNTDRLLSAADRLRSIKHAASVGIISNWSIILRRTFRHCIARFTRM